MSDYLYYLYKDDPKKPKGVYMGPGHCYDKYYFSSIEVAKLDCGNEIYLDVEA